MPTPMTIHIDGILDLSDECTLQSLRAKLKPVFAAAVDQARSEHLLFAIVSDGGDEIEVRHLRTDTALRLTGAEIPLLTTCLMNWYRSS